MKSCRRIPTFRRNTLPPSLAQTSMFVSWLSAMQGRHISTRLHGVMSQKIYRIYSLFWGGGTLRSVDW